jgi:hypothetical protein
MDPRELMGNLISRRRSSPRRKTTLTLQGLLLLKGQEEADVAAVQKCRRRPMQRPSR